MAITSYNDALAFWYRRANFELTTPLPADLRLERMRSLLELIGNPHERLRVLHIAGSKGKGSTAAMLAAILRQAGYRTGLFTSPHLSHVEERIQVNGEPIFAGELVTLLDQVESALRNKDLEPTFFEIATALGFLHFVNRRVDAAVIEVGLGGRFDSTNLCLPLVSIITSISFDHTRQLGNTLASIAREKAGIIKPGRPVVSGVTAPEAREVIEEVCRPRASQLLQLGRDFTYRYEPGFIRNDEDRPARFGMVSQSTSWPPFSLRLLGEHQAANAAVTLACIEQLRAMGWQIPDSAVAKGLMNVDWPARMEVMSRRPLVVVDCAHNVASARALAETLLTSFPRTRRHLVFACSTDKDIPGMLGVLAPHFEHIYLTRFESPRAAEPGSMIGMLPQSCAYSVHDSATGALAAARTAAGGDDLICIAGSVFLAGELRRTTG